MVRRKAVVRSHGTAPKPILAYPADRYVCRYERRQALHWDAYISFRTHQSSPLVEDRFEVLKRHHHDCRGTGIALPEISENARVRVAEAKLQLCHIVQSRTSFEKEGARVRWTFGSGKWMRATSTAFSAGQDGKLRCARNWVVLPMERFDRRVTTSLKLS
jgi:hypothetical protein